MKKYSTMERFVAKEENIIELEGVANCGVDKLIASKSVLTNGISELMGFQRLVSTKMQGDANLKGGPTEANLRLYALALITEVSELVEAMVGKPWKDSAQDADGVLDEMADVLAFVGVMLDMVRQHTGATAADLALAYINKTGRNLRRMRGAEAGYEANVEVHQAVISALQHSQIKVNNSNGALRLCYYCKGYTHVRGETCFACEGEGVVSDDLPF